MLKLPFKFSPDDRRIGAGMGLGQCATPWQTAREGETTMTELTTVEPDAPAVMLPAPTSPEAMLELGMIYSSGRSVTADLVTAHQWFNLAATFGSVDAAQLRREIAAEMSDAEIGRAQRAARDWLKANPDARPAPAPRLRAAA
jgi:TPR repeat protein